MAMALRSGATAVFDVINELDRLVGTLSAKAAGADLAGDTARFMATFRNTYLGAADSGDRRTGKARGKNPSNRLW